MHPGTNIHIRHTLPTPYDLASVLTSRTTTPSYCCRALQPPKTRSLHFTAPYKRCTTFAKKALLESGKTLSRKARARPDSKTATPISSPAASPFASKNVSRAGSVYASEGEEDSDFEDHMTMSTNSGSDSEGGSGSNNRAWVDRLQARTSQIIAGGRSGERKKMSNMEKEDMLKAYLHLVRHYFAQAEIRNSMDELVLGLMRAVKSASTSEKMLALKALAVSILTNPTDSILSSHEKDLKDAAEDDSSEEEVKIAAIHTLAVAAMYGDGGVEAAEDMLQYMIEIIESDGQTVGALDVGGVVVAALQSWGFIAAHLDDLTDQSEQAMEAFVGQLDSTDPYVQTAAGDNIALLFETATATEEETGEKANLQYDPKRLAQQMRDASRGVQEHVEARPPTPQERLQQHCDGTRARQGAGLLDGVQSGHA